MAMEINNALIQQLLDQARANPRLRQNYDLRDSAQENSQRMLNALLPGTEVPVHRHPNSSEVVSVLCGKAVELFYGEDGSELMSVALEPAAGSFGCVVPQGVWHTIQVLEPTVILEMKAGRFGEDGSETYLD